MSRCLCVGSCVLCFDILSILCFSSVFSSVLFPPCSLLCLFPFLLACLSPSVCQYCFLDAFSSVFPSLSHLSSSLFSLLTCSSSPHQCVCVFKLLFPMYSLSVCCWCLTDVPLESLVFPFVSPVSCFGFWFLFFFFLGLIWTLPFFVFCFSCYFVFLVLVVFLFVSLVFVLIQLCLKLKLTFCSSLSCLSRVCIWVHLKFSPPRDNWLALALLWWGI